MKGGNSTNIIAPVVLSDGLEVMRTFEPMFELSSETVRLRATVVWCDRFYLDIYIAHASVEGGLELGVGCGA